MLTEIIRRTPFWVWPALAFLLWRGFAMSRPHRIAVARTALLPAVMLLLSLVGVLSAFGARADVLLCWAAGLALAAYETQRRGPLRDARYLPRERAFDMPGSWTPLLLFLLIFAVKYGVGVSLALHGALRANGWFGLGVALAYGAISGLFLGRTLRQWQARRQPPVSGLRPASP